MRKFLAALLLTLAIAGSVVALAPTRVVYAEETPAGSATTATEDPAKKTPTNPIPKVEADGLLTQGMNAILSIFAWLVGVAAITLDMAMYYTVVKMGSLINNLDAVGVTWRILRDIGNIALLFGFIAIGVCVIFDSPWYGGGYKMLPMLLVAAVALNFSLFFAEAVIDTGNLFATQIYMQINGGDAVTGEVSFEKALNNGIASKLMAQLGFVTIYGSPLTNPEAFNTDNNLIVGFMGILLFLTTALVLFSLAFMLIARFVVLVMVIITSPVGIVGLGVPQLKSLSDTWFNYLTKQTITAPAMLLMLYVALAVITDVQFLRGFEATNWGAFMGGEWSGFIGIFLSFLVAIGLLLMVLTLSSKLSATGSAWAIKWGGRLSFGATAYGMSAATSGFFGGTRRLAQRFAPTTRFTRGYSRVANFAENRTFDMRRIPGVGAGLTLANAGAAAGPVGASTGNRYRQGREWWRTTSQTSSRTVDQQTRLDRLRSATTADLVAPLLGNFSDKELESSAVQRILEGNDLAVAMLSQAKFDKLMSSDVLSDVQKDRLRRQRENDPRFVDRAASAATLGRMSTEQRSQLPGAILVRGHVLDQLQAADFNQIQRRAALNDAQRNTVGTHIRTQLAAARAAAVGARSPQQTALIAAAAAPQFQSYYNVA